MRKFLNYELSNFAFSQSTIRVIKLRGIKWAGLVALVVEMRNSYTILAETSERKGHLEEVEIDGRIIRYGS